MSVPVESTAPREGPLRALLVEDNPGDARLIRELLKEGREEGSIELRWESTLERARAVLEEAPVDVVLLDLHLPDSSGISTLEEVVPVHPEVAVVVLTGLDDAALAAHAVRSGAQDYLIKGRLGPELLVKALRYAAASKRDEIELRRSQGRLEAIFEQATDAILLADDEGNYLEVNPAASRLTGYSRNELLAMSIGDLATPEFRPGTADRYRTFRKRGREEGEFTLVCKDGRTVHVEYRAVAGIQPGVHLSVLTDVTERNRAAEELRSGAERMRLLLQQVPALLWTLDCELVVTSAQGSGLATLGVDREQVLGRHLTDFFDAADHDAVRGHRRALEGRKVSYQLQFGGRALDAHVEPFRDQSGAIVGVIGVAFDITDRVATEKALRESEERYRRFFEEDLTGDCIAAPGGQILECNPAFAEMFGFGSVDQALRADLVDLFPDREVRRRFMHRIRQEGKVERYEAEGRRLSGEPVFLIANVIANFDASGDLVDLRGYLFDDTERRRTEQQLLQAQKMEAVGRLAGGVAHDFNNLITAMGGYSDLCLMALPEESPARDYLEEIKRSGQRAADLARQLLAFSRMQVLRSEVLDLNQVVSGTDRMLRRLIGEDIVLSTRLTSHLPPVQADPGQLEQVIVNLAINARDAMPRGGELSIDTSVTELTAEDADRFGFPVQPGAYVKMTIRDTGCGMTPDVREHVFEPFYTTKEPGQGTGLGLSTVYGIVKQTGGYITVESLPGTGSRFDLYLPRAESELEPERRPRPTAAEREESRGRETILVVEDERPLRRLLVEILLRYGYTVLEAADGREAMRICRDLPDQLHLVISDVVMPDIGGPELEGRLAEILPEVKVLFISGYPGETVVRRGDLAQGRPFLQKPFDQETLVGTVRKLLDDRE